MGKFCGALTRRRTYSSERVNNGDLKRCLSLWELVSLGVGSSAGVGAFVVLGGAAMSTAGPSVVMSYLLAAVAALFAGLCYGEWSSRLPLAGSAYSYAHVALGEFVAFVVGWCLILEGLFGAASLARGLSMFVDSLSNHTMSAWFESFAPIAVAPFSQYFDFLAFFVVLLMGGILCIGVRRSTMINHVFTGITIVIIFFVIIAGSFKADYSNWTLSPTNVTAGNGGFFPYGVWGTVKGAAVCFYGFVGFDLLTFAAEEVREPRRSIPIAILCVIGVLLLLYISTSTVVTMMVPYYLQDKLSTVTTAFTYVGMEWAMWIAAVGLIFGILASLFGSMFPIPRILYAMASDGLLCPCLATVSTSQQTLIFATVLPTVIIALLGAMLDLGDLIMMMCLGTLLAYSVVAACVVVSRYRSKFDVAGSGYWKHMIGCGEKLPCKTTTNIILINLLLFVAFCIAIGLIIRLAGSPLIYVIVLHLLAVLTVVSMTLQPKIQEEVAFKTPLVPIIPCISIYLNIQLMVHLNLQTWIRVLIWIAIGLPVYLICMCCFREKEKDHDNLENNLKQSSQVNGKPPVQIYVESPTPPGTTKGSISGGDKITHNPIIEEITVDTGHDTLKQPIVTEEIIVQHAFVENNAEKEAKIIDLLDQVLQAEEDSYGEIISLKDKKDEDVVSLTDEPVLHRKSLSELSDAGSDASLGNLVLSKYDVVAQVHREDLPMLTEEDEKNDIEKKEIAEEITDHEDVTAFNDSDSRTDESGYSDTIDKTGLNESIGDSKEDIPNIPSPPPLDENYFKSPTFIKSYTISSRPSKSKPVEFEEENKPRESVKSNNSFDDTPMVFGSDKQLHFMSKLNNLFQNKMKNENKNVTDEQRRRSNSTGDRVENNEISWTRERPSIPSNLMRDIASREALQNLRPIEIEEKKLDSDSEEENSLSRNELKTKLESIFAAGGPKLTKSRTMQSNPPTPEEAYQTDTSSSESITKLPHMEKNDTLKRQKTKFGEVLNSFRLTLNKDDEVL
ncbi:cationic amino acid transporter 2-like [Aricia agestis]|uniref:cationic amino acid transporter 2-like n=1 Tax=Aricia agestis TaxID=91739 RepID=UPI001C209084|nr:cationic amino acid transporter 2-like [Aricia agestis]XP_041979228.1 cationic amino acid transporter 2-like [Aricia agestis]XP_041979229.1 cationic amino acid transporter 2-like [Aricia agestis]XP_041979230.1 cationic amino acid transporter 2-like [Aricia agestis]